MVTPTLVDRLAILAGAGLIVYGASMLSAAVALMVAGSLLLAGAIWRRT